MCICNTKMHTKASDKAIFQNICSFEMVSWKIVSVLTKFWESSPGKFDLFSWLFFLLENLMCSNEIWTRSPRNFDLFLWYFWRMCSCGILRKLSWKFWCVLVRFVSPGKFICVLIPFLVLLEKMACSYKRIMSSPGNFICVLLTSKPPGKVDVF